MTAQIEQDNAGQPFGNFFEEVSIFCSGAIIASAASLEALINELYIAPGALHDSLPNFDESFWGTSDSSTWFSCVNRANQRRGLVRQSALMKYRKALRLLKRPSLSKRDAPFRHAETLIGFRNYLIHFKPLWDNARRHTSLEAELTDLFDLSPFPDDGADFLTKKCMSAGCADWSVSTTRNFIQYFARMSELDPRKLGAFT